jgi:ATP-dependent helicase HrpA
VKPRPRPPAAAHPVPPITYPESLPVSAGARRSRAPCRAPGGHRLRRDRLGQDHAAAQDRARARPRPGRRRRRGLIGHTQPRRIAASSVAKRIAEELNSPLGEVVGYKVRFQDRLQPGASVKLMTDGILLAETQSDPLLQGLRHADHRRGARAQPEHRLPARLPAAVLPRRPDLKLIVTSATIDADRFAKHFASRRAGRRR